MRQEQSGKEPWTRGCTEPATVVLTSPAPVGRDRAGKLENNHYNPKGALKKFILNKIFLLKTYERTVLSQGELRRTTSQGQQWPQFLQRPLFPAPVHTRM